MSEPRERINGHSTAAVMRPTQEAMSELCERIDEHSTAAVMRPTKEGS
ncbi:hypothetical protein EDD27_4712 [Nonomuraea polychroma]|uniref:Uncharacterized protein n=1 Tax=Nonomuraea polychroma TaxID=46176 RepID=A0A438M8P6_9ACTN|nr:hypothetical protein EDD27_4712 [Nonomuraea polychroma]